jgi:guanylate kinase
MKYKILAIVGPSGCGKDSLLKLLSKKKVVNTIITSTTRPIRSNEIKDRDYHFLTKEQFAEKVLDLEMIEATVFNDWCYGTDKSTLSEDKINIGVFNPYSIDILADNSQIDLKIIYLRCSDKERLLR